MLRYAMSYMLVVSHVHSSYILSLNGSPVGLSPPANIYVYIYIDYLYIHFICIYIYIYIDVCVSRCNFYIYIYFM